MRRRSVGRARLDKFTQLTQAFEEGDHACVKASVEEHSAQRKITR